MSKRLKAWQYVRNVRSVRNLPPYTTIEDTTFVGGKAAHMIFPDRGSVSFALQEGELEYTEFVEPDYRGLCVEVSDHGNITLYMRYKNGNKREIWGAV